MNFIFKKNAGMAMLEVLIAMGVVAVGVLPLVYLQIKADRSVVSAYTKVEHNAVALSIMDMVSADANKNNWVFNLASGECDPSKESGSDGESSSSCSEWRKTVTDNLLTNILPNAGSGLVCITQDDIAKDSDALDHSIRMKVELWWYSAGRGKADIVSTQDSKSKEGAFVAGDCGQLGTFADKLNIDTVSITRIF